MAVGDMAQAPGSRVGEVAVQALPQGEDWGDAPFVFSRPEVSIVAHDAVRGFPSGAAAADALRAGTVAAIVGALAFHPDDPAALFAPSHLDRRPGPLRADHAAVSAGPDPLTIEERPSRRQHGERIDAALAALRAPLPAVRKVVLARALHITTGRPIDPHHLLARLIERDTGGNGFAVDLSAGRRASGASPVPHATDGEFLVGSSPEVLIRRRGTRIEAHPLAGSAPRDDDPAIDRRNARLLSESAKNLAEHAYLIDHMRQVLAPLCTQLDIPDAPAVTSTPQLWHLGTPITGILADPAPSALDVALALHPTPAICGTPTDRALRMIEDLEQSRGFYAGAVGWADAAGDGEWMVAIRCATVSADRRSLIAHAGGGIVAGSTVDDEIDETTTKFRTILTALGGG